VSELDDLMGLAAYKERAEVVFAEQRAEIDHLQKEIQKAKDHARGTERDLRAKIAVLEPQHDSLSFAQEVAFTHLGYTIEFKEASRGSRTVRIRDRGGRVLARVHQSPEDVLANGPAPLLKTAAWRVENPDTWKAMEEEARRQADAKKQAAQRAFDANVRKRANAKRALKERIHAQGNEKAS